MSILIVIKDTQQRENQKQRQRAEALVNGSHGDEKSSAHRRAYYDSCHSQFQFTALMLVKWFIFKGDKMSLGQLVWVGRVCMVSDNLVLGVQGTDGDQVTKQANRFLKNITCSRFLRKNVVVFDI